MAPRNSSKNVKKKAENTEDTTAAQSTATGKLPRRPSPDEATVSAAGHSSVVPSELSMEEFNDTLQSRIVQALCTKEVVDVITKALSEAILDSVTQRVYESIDHDLQTKLKSIKDLEKGLADLERKISKVTNDLKEQELYSRRNCLRIYGIAGSPNEDTVAIVMDLAKQKLGIELTQSEIDRSHRLEIKHPEGSSGPNPILVKFTRYNMRDNVYRARSKLRGTNIFINEHLTKDRQSLFKKVAAARASRKAWTSDFKITALTTDNRKVRVNTERDLEKTIEFQILSSLKH